MASGTGMAGLAVTALVSALVAFGVASLLPAGPGPAPAPAPVPPPAAPSGAGTEELRAAKPAPARPGRNAKAGLDGTPAADGVTDPSGPVPATRAELAAFVDERIEARPAAAPAAAAPAEVPKRKTIEEAGAELGLSSVDIDSVKRVWEESEREAVTMLMGTGDMDAIKEEVKAAEDDPDKKAALINKVVGNAFRNLGKMATIEGRRNRELKKFLSEEQVRKLKGMRIAPVTEGANLEGIMKGTFGD